MDGCVKIRFQLSRDGTTPRLLLFSNKKGESVVGECLPRDKHIELWNAHSYTRIFVRLHRFLKELSREGVKNIRYVGVFFYPFSEEISSFFVGAINKVRVSCPARDYCSSPQNWLFADRESESKQLVTLRFSCPAK
jgi:hypothetical protein